MGCGYSKQNQKEKVVKRNLENKASKEEFEKKMLVGHRKVITSLIALSQNRIASGSYDNTVRIWDLVNYFCISIITLNSPVLCLCQRKDGCLMIGLKKEEISIWTPFRLLPLQDSPKGARMIIILANSALLTVSLWNKVVILKHSSHQDTIRLEEIPTAFRQLRNSLVAIGFINGSVGIWDMNTYKQVNQYAIDVIGVAIDCILELSDNSLAIYSSNSSAIYIVKQGKITNRYEAWLFDLSYICSPSLGVIACSSIEAIQIHFSKTRTKSPKTTESTLFLELSDSVITFFFNEQFIDWHI